MFEKSISISIFYIYIYIYNYIYNKGLFDIYITGYLLIK